jgi:predicted nuclease of predicted toxin-antitoxin system
MKLLLDMGLAPRTAVFLSQQGHDAVHLRSRGQATLSDEEITREAEREGRIVVTFDFARIIALQRLSQPSVILLRLERFTTDEVNRILVDVLRTYQSELQAGSILVIDSNRIRLRTLPIW